LTTRASEYEVEKTRLESQIQQQNFQIGTLSRERDQLVEHVANLEKKLKEQEEKIAQGESTMNEIPALKQQIADKETALAELQKKYETNTAAMQADNQKIKAQLANYESEIATLSQEREQLVEHVASLEKKLKEQEEKIAQGERTMNEIPALKQQIVDKETALTALQKKYETETAAMQADNQKIKTQLASYESEITTLQENKANAEKQISEYQAQVSKLQEEIQQYTLQLNDYKSKVAWLEEDVNKREAEYGKQIELHNRMIEQLKEDIDNQNMEKESIQNRLQQELDRSKTEYQKRLDTLASEKEQKIQELQSLATTYQNLAQSLKKEIEEKSVTIEQYKEKLTVKIVNKILFASGRAEINAEGIQVLNTVGELLKQNLEGRQIRVEGHTDNVLIGPNLIDKYPTNWELSAARAVNVVRYLQERVEIPPDKIFAVGYGAYHPVASNDTPEGRALNRRIEIVLTPELERSEFR
jgi:chemotaxis protein MotB